MQSELKGKELKIKVQKDLTTYLTFSLPLCAILSDDRMYPWFYQHFVQLYTLTDENGNLWVDYLEERDFYKDIAEYKIYDYISLKQVENIIEFIKDKINHGYYVIIYLDEYYLPKKAGYMKFHFLHQLMVYGYDNESQRLKTVAFDRKQEFVSAEYEYSKIVKSYEEGKTYYELSPIWVLNETVELIRPKGENSPYEFNLGLFLEELKVYLLGQGEYSKLRPNNLETNGKQASFNFKVYDELIYHLNNLIQGNPTMDYRYVHLMMEHKIIMYYRLKYIISNYSSNDDLVMLIEEYSNLVKKMQVARNLFFKQVIAELSGIEVNFSKIFTKVLEIVRFAKDEECRILTSIYDLLKANFIQ